jgi:hypothetical protein
VRNASYLTVANKRPLFVYLLLFQRHLGSMAIFQRLEVYVRITQKITVSKFHAQVNRRVKYLFAAIVKPR